MKKVLFITMVTGLIFASCRKDRTCECKTTSDAPGFVSETTVTTQKKVSKSDALANCQSYTTKATAPVAGTYYFGEDCELK